MPIDALRSVSASCNRFFPALTASPNAGRSSAGTLPNSLERSMILLCFPRYVTRSFSSSSLVAARPISSTAAPASAATSCETASTRASIVSVFSSDVIPLYQTYEIQEFAISGSMSLVPARW